MCEQVVTGPESFGTEAEYEAFLRARLRPGTRLVGVAGDRKGKRCSVVSAGWKVLAYQWEPELDASLQSAGRDVALEVCRPRSLSPTPSSAHAAWL